jgi:hypothetical protein
MSAFALFVQRYKGGVERENPGISAIDVIQKLAGRWAVLSPSDKVAFQEQSLSVYRSYHTGTTFAFEDGLAVRGDPTNDAFVEAMVDAAGQIAILDQPADPSAYLSWLGARVIDKYYTAHGALPRAFVARLRTRPVVGDVDEGAPGQ